MNNETLFTTLVLGLAATVGVVGTVTALGAFLHFDQRWGDRLILWIIPLIALGVAISTAVSGRNLQSEMPGSPSQLSEWVARVLSFLIVVISATRLMGYAFSGINGKNTNDKNSGWEWVLFVGVLLMMTCTVVSPAFLAPHTEFSSRMLYPGIALVALWAGRTVPTDDAIAVGKWTLLLFCAGSLVLALVKPELAMNTGYERSWIPGLRLRLAGLGSHANSTGPLGLVTILLLLAAPIRHRTLQLGGLLVGALVLVLAQSKTAWAVAVLTVPWILLVRSGVHRLRLTLPVLTALHAGAAVVVVVWLAADFSIASSFDSSSSAGRDLNSLSGRDAIWRAAWETWQQSPIVGYGHDAWGPRHRLLLGMPFAVSAHQGVLQILSVAGLVGLFGWLLYATGLCLVAIQVNRATRGLSTALLLLFVARTLTETPWDLKVLLGSDFLLHALWFCMCSGGLRATAHGNVSPDAAPPHSRPAVHPV